MRVRDGSQSCDASAHHLIVSDGQVAVSERKASGVSARRGCILILQFVRFVKFVHNNLWHPYFVYNWEAYYPILCKRIRHEICAFCSPMSVHYRSAVQSRVRGAGVTKRIENCSNSLLG